jgi:hypothetical protein
MNAALSQITVEDFITLIERQLPQLWEAHARSGNRALRTVLRSAESLLAQQAGMDVATFRRTRRTEKRTSQPL